MNCEKCREVSSRVDIVGVDANNLLIYFNRDTKATYQDGMDVFDFGICHLTPCERRLLASQRPDLAAHLLKHASKDDCVVQTANPPVLKMFWLEQIVDRVNSMPRPIVMVNGCFDIVHIGHIGMLKWAKQQGKTLVVAVNSDYSVRALKGEGRPYQTLEWRVAVLESFWFVDFVVPFQLSTPVGLIDSLSPDIIVKGWEYANTPELPELQGYRGEVRYAPRYESVSTTEFVNGLTSSAVDVAIARDRQETIGAVLT